MTDRDSRFSSAPPPVIAYKRVLHYAVLDDPQGKFPLLAICEQKKSPKYLLLFCDRDWVSEAVMAENSVEGAKRLAECICPMSLPRWVDARVTEEDATRYLDEMFEGQRCSFCNKRPDEVPQIFGIGYALHICGECIEEFHAHLRMSHQH